MISNPTEPLALRHLTRLPDESEPSEHERFDEGLQLWISTISGQPLVAEFSREMRSPAGRSEFGETLVTMTREGVDQSEALRASRFGETINTRTREGYDQTEVLKASRFGETLITETREGIDKTESVSS